jgi:cation transport regulator ChaC
MITHVVFFKVPEAHRQTVVDRLRAMEGQVAGLTSITVGVDVNRSPRAWDLCLISTHEDESALTAYQADPLHVEVKRTIAEVAEASAVVDFAS